MLVPAHNRHSQRGGGTSRCGWAQTRPGATHPETPLESQPLPPPPGVIPKPKEACSPPRPWPAAPAPSPAAPSAPPAAPGDGLGRGWVHPSGAATVTDRGMAHLMAHIFFIGSRGIGHCHWAPPTKKIHWLPCVTLRVPKGKTANSKCASN